MAENDAKQPIEFWFDFVSPYAYFTALEIEDLALRHAREVVWRPFLLGPTLKLTGARALINTPLKADYAKRDWARIARMREVPFVLPARLANALPAVRVFYHLESRSQAAASAFAKAVFQGHFQSRLDCGDIDDVVALAGELGHEQADVRVGMADPAIRARAISLSEEATARGVFGVPWIFVEEEPFWGWDRLPMVETFLAHPPQLTRISSSP